MNSTRESGPPLSVRGRGLAKDTFENKRDDKCRRISALDASAGANEGANASSGSSSDDVWKMLPDELINVIRSWLPFAAQCRFRCVCKKWRGIQSVPPSHTVLSQSEDQTTRFYCESERKWFNLPSNNPPSFRGKLLTDIISCSGQGMEGEVIDVEGGIVCSQFDVGGRFWFWIRNPLGTSMSRLISPTYSRKYLPKPPKVKLLVNRASKMFKLVALLDTLPWTTVYEPTASAWHVYVDSHPRYQLVELFSWENVIHAYSTQLKLGHQGSVVSAFNTHSGEWTEIEVEIPSSEFGVSTHQCFVSDGNQLLLVLFSKRKRPRPCLSVWKFLGTTADNRKKWAKWQQIIPGVEGAVVDLAGHRLTSVCCGPEYICFRFSDDNRIKKKDDFGTQKCVRYSFASKIWGIMQCPGNGSSGGSFTLYNWEPNLDIDPSFVRTPSGS